MIETQVVPAEIEQLANDVSAWIVNNPDRVVPTQGEITIVAYRDGRRFGRQTLNATTLISPSWQRFTDAQLRRLAADVRAKVRAEAPQIGPSVKVVTIRIHSRGNGYDIALGVEY